MNFARYFSITQNNTLRDIILATLNRPFLADKLIKLLIALQSPVSIAGINLELTNRCNLSCAMCPHKEMARPQGCMDINLFKNIVDQSAEFRFPIQYFCLWGEPLLYDHFEEAMKYFHARGFGEGVLATNGLLLNEEKRNIIARYCRHILIAVDSSDESAYRLIRKNDQFSVLCDNVKKLIAQTAGSGGAKVTIQYLRTALNTDETIRDFIKMFGQHRNVKYITRTTRHYPESLDLRIRGSKYDVRTCHLPYIGLPIAWNGDCALCCFDCEVRQKIGNVNENNLIEIWKGAKATEIRKCLNNGLFDDLPVCKICSGPG